jgi:hypothetical protein
MGVKGSMVGYCLFTDFEEFYSISMKAHSRILRGKRATPLTRYVPHSHAAAEPDELNPVQAKYLCNQQPCSAISTAYGL